MNIQLAPSWELTTEHAASSYGQLVLVYRPSGEAYGSGDIVVVNGQVKGTAAGYALRMAKTIGPIAIEAANRFARQL